MKAPAALLLVSVLTLACVVFQVLTAKPRAKMPAGLALIHATVEYCVICKEKRVYGIDTAFRSHGQQQQGDANRRQLLKEANAYRAKDPRTAFMEKADADCLATPNTSAELLALQAQQVRKHGNKAPEYTLTISVPCRLPDEMTGYYVETRRRDGRWGNGEIFVLRKGAIVGRLHVWVN